jgi:hypothetical protein
MRRFALFASYIACNFAFMKKTAGSAASQGFLRGFLLVLMGEYFIRLIYILQNILSLIYLITERVNMKTKIWIMVGVLIIAFATMAVPVMAGTGGTIGASGDQISQYDITIPNDTVSFGDFAIASNKISPDHPGADGKWAVIKGFYTTDPIWFVKVNGNHLKMTDGTHPLGASMTIKNATDQSGSGITGLGSALTLTTDATTLVSGSAALGSTDIPLYIEQTVAASDPIGHYTMTITVSYSTTA